MASSTSATGRSCAAVGGDQPLARLGTAERAEHRADDARTESR